MLGGDLRGRAVTPDPTGEDGVEHSGFHAEPKDQDPIAALLARLAAAAATGAPMSVGRRARVTVRRVPGGFAVERSVGR